MARSQPRHANSSQGAATAQADARRGRPGGAPPHPRAAELARLDGYARLMDARWRIPGTGWRFGLDSVVGLVPGVGDLATAAPQAWLIWQGHRMGARRGTLARMAVNTGLDLTVGAIPILGDLFDMAFKANLRNVALLRREIAGAPEE